MWDTLVISIKPQPFPSCCKSGYSGILEFITLFLRREPRMPWMWRKGSQLQTLSCRVFATCWVGGWPKALSFQGNLVQWPVKSFEPPCWKESGCTALVSAGTRARHATTCLFRPVRCPKAIFSSSCLYKGPYCTIQVLLSDLGKTS